MERIADPVPLELIAEIVAFVDPVVVGVPLTRPVLVFRLNPNGKPLVEKLVGLFVAMIW